MLHSVIMVRIIACRSSFTFDFECLGSHVSSGGSTKELTRQYFTEINITTARKLYELYKVDFEMFGYSPEEYFEQTKTS